MSRRKASVDTRAILGTSGCTRDIGRWMGIGIRTTGQGCIGYGLSRAMVTTIICTGGSSIRAIPFPTELSLSLFLTQRLLSTTNTYVLHHSHSHSHGAPWSQIHSPPTPLQSGWRAKRPLSWSYRERWKKHPRATLAEHKC